VSGHQQVEGTTGAIEDRGPGTAGDSPVDGNGLLGVLAYPPAVDPSQPTLDRLIDHIDHATAIMGIEHVALGANFFRQVYNSGAFRTPPDAGVPAGMTMGEPLQELGGPDQYPNLVQKLQERGYTDSRLEAILSGNLLEFLKRTLPSVR
jgi:membrane dipeptidase